MAPQGTHKSRINNCFVSPAVGQLLLNVNGLCYLGGEVYRLGAWSAWNCQVSNSNMSLKCEASGSMVGAPIIPCLHVSQILLCLQVCLQVSQIPLLPAIVMSCLDSVFTVLTLVAGAHHEANVCSACRCFW